MADITIVNGVYKPTYNWGAPSCRKVNIDLGLFKNGISLKIAENDSDPEDFLGFCQEL